MSVCFGKVLPDVTVEQFMDGIDELFPYICQRKNIWWVDWSAGADTNTGEYASPVATLRYAIENLAGDGDTIFVEPGVNESVGISTALTISQNGLHIISRKRRWYFGDPFQLVLTGTGAKNINITGNGVRLEGISIQVAATSLGALTPIQMAGDGAILRSCSMVQSWKAAASKMVEMSGDGCIVQNCDFHVAGEPFNAIHIQGDDGQVIDNTFNSGQVSTTGLGSTLITVAANNLHTLIRNNRMLSYDTTTSQTLVEILSTSKGVTAYNGGRVSPATAFADIFKNNGHAAIQNFATDVTAKSGGLLS